LCGDHKPRTWHVNLVRPEGEEKLGLVVRSHRSEYEVQAKCDQQFEGYWRSNERTASATSGCSRVDKDDGDLKDDEYRSQRESSERRVYSVGRKADGAPDIGAPL